MGDCRMNRQARMRKNITQIHRILREAIPTPENERIIAGTLANLAYSIDTFAKIYRADDQIENLP